MCRLPVLAWLSFACLALAAAQDYAPPPPPDMPSFPPADTLFTGPYGFERGPPTWTEVNASSWANITVVRDGYYEKYGELVGIQIGYDNGKVGPWHYKAYDPKAYHRKYTMDLTLNGTGHDDITSMVLFIQYESPPPYFSAITTRTASGANFTLGVATGTPMFILSPCPQGAYALDALSGANLPPATVLYPRYMRQLGFKWKLVAPEMFNAIQPVENPWICKPWLGFTRKGSNGQPECLSFDNGTTCTTQGCQIQQVDGQCTFDDLPGLTATTKVCIPRKDTTTSGTMWDDPTDYCPRAAAALELPVDIPTPYLSAFVILDVCDLGPAMNATIVRQIMYDDPLGLQNYFNDVSLGRAVFNNKTAILKTIKIPCSFKTSKQGIYAFSDWNKYIQDNNATLFPDMAKYPKIVYIGPPVNCPAWGCSEAGQGFPGGQVYILGAKGRAAQALYLFKHEIGHALGLSHSANNESSAGDGSTPMGVCDNCLYSAPHLVQQLGWRTTLASLSDFNFPIDSTNTYQVPALTDAAQSVVYVRLDWGNKTSSIFISLRVAKGQDIGLPAEYAKRVSVHTADWQGDEWNIPRGFQIPSDFPSPYTRLVSVLGVNDTWSQDGLTVRHVAFDAKASTSTIKVCRRAVGKTAAAPDDC